MIGWLLGTRVGRGLSALVAAVALFAGIVIHQRHDAAKDATLRAANEAMNDERERIENGRAAVRAGRDLDPADRLRSNDGRWE